MTTMRLPLAKVPAVISESAATTLRAHALELSPELVRELGRNVAQALLSLDLVAFAGDEPSAADRLRVGETLRMLARSGSPDPEIAELLMRVGEWLGDAARAELGLPQRRAHADTLTLLDGGYYP